jgi:hypothetical protein
VARNNSTSGFGKVDSRMLRLGCQRASRTLLRRSIGTSVDYRSRSRDTAKGSLGSSEGNWLALKMSLHAPFKTKYLIQNKRNIFPFRLNLRGRFDVYERPIFYLELNFTPKFGTRIYRNTSEHKVAVEVPKDLVRRKTICVFECNGEGENNRS